MSTTKIAQVIKLIERLTPEERRRVRELMDSARPQGPEDEVDRRLLEGGLIRQIPRRPADRGPNPQPISVQGKPVSQTIVEERR